MKTLKLNNLKKQYVKVNKGKREVYFDKENNNLIVIDPIDKQCDTHSICNGISPDAYDELIECLNEYVNIVVHWTQIERTTSDYTIYHDMNSSALINNTVNEILNEVNESVIGERLIQFKYTEVLDGLESKIDFIRDEKAKNQRTGIYIDHINCNKWDNRIDNLRSI